MSIATELERIKAAKADIKSKLAEMGVTSNGNAKLSDCAAAMGGIVVYDSADEVTVEDSGSPAATYNLHGYYKNIFLTHPDAVAGDGDTTELQNTINSLRAELANIETQLQGI